MTVVLAVVVGLIAVIALAAAVLGMLWLVQVVLNSGEGRRETR